MGIIYFGNKERFTSIPAPFTEADASHVGRSNIVQLDNGGAVVEESLAQHREFSWQWIGDPREHAIIRSFFQGVYGRGPFYFTDPFSWDVNLMPPNWASPRIIADGDWKDIYDTRYSTSTATPANPYGLPSRRLTYNLGSAAANVLPAVRHTIMIPPGYALWAGASGLATGTGAIGIRGIKTDGTFTPVSTYQPLAETGSTRYFSNGVFRASDGLIGVEIFLTKTGSGAALLVLAAMVAKLAREGTAPQLETTFVPGEGFGGLRFSGGLKETMYYAGNGTQKARKGFALKLVEVEPWER